MGGRYSSVLSAVLFLALCAYVGAGLYAHSEKKNTASVSRVTISDCAELYGIALREEQSFDCSACAENGERLPAGSLFALDNRGEEMLSPASAVFFDFCDGYEYLSPDSAETISVSSVEALLSLPAETPGDARLVTGRAWYYAALTSADAPLPPKGLCRITPDGFSESLQAYIVSVSAVSEGRRALLLRLTEDSPACLSLRHFSASLAGREYTGLMVPEKAIHEENGTEFVNTVTEGGETRVPVDIIYSGAGFCLVSPEDSPLRVGSRVITE